MPEPRDAFIRYDGLPISAGGVHHIRSRNPVAVWAQFALFLDRCASDIHYHGIYLSVRDGSSTSAANQAAGVEAFRRYGVPTRRNRVSAERPADVVYDNTWELQQEDISDLVEWLAKQDVPEDEYLLPSVRVFVHATFKLKDPRTGFTLPFQGLEYYGGMGHGPSHIEAAIARKSHCGLNLNLPYVEATAEAREYVKELEAFLPFKLSRKHWTLWKLTKAGTGYYRWKGIDMLGASLSHLTNVSS